MTTRRTTAKTIFWIIAFLTALYFLFDPIDRYKPSRRSDRRPIPIAQSQADRSEAIRLEVGQLLDRIMELWRTKYPDERIGNFAPPATEAQIEELEHHVGPLPVDFRSYLQLYNGHADHRGGFYGYQPLLSCESMLRESKGLLSIGKDYQEIPLRHEGVWFHPGCLIFEEQDGGGYVINATTGVIYRWDHDGGPLAFLAESFTALLKRMVRNLEAGEGPTTSFSKTEAEDLGR